MHFLDNLPKDKVTEWFAKNYQASSPILYSSVDIRNSGFKIAPVDTNIFPAGFNQLSARARENASRAIKNYFLQNYPELKTVGLFAENFTRNKFYWENIASLKSIIENAGYQVVIGITEETTESLEPKPHKLERRGNKIFFGEQSPCIIISNRDFTGGSPPEFADISQTVIPPISMGWYRRRKSRHFESYDKISSEFANEFSFDPWLISSIHEKCGKIDFKNREGLDCVAQNVEKTLFKIRKKYEQYKIDSEPYVFIKSDSGTFGMGIMTARSGLEVVEMNKKLRNKMDIIKEGVQSTEVIIQEGIPTIDEVNGHPAEPFVYLIGNTPIGAIMRVNQSKDRFGNLNSSGMGFEKMECNEIEENCENSSLGIISRLATLAALHESEIMKAVA